MQFRLPSNHEAEQQILGALLFREELFYDITGELDGDDFADRGHAAIYRTIESLLNTGRRVNVTLVRDFMGSIDSRAKVDAAYLEQLMDAVADPRDTIHYAHQVTDLARRRRIMVAMMEGVSKLGKLDPLVTSQALIDEVETEILAASRVSQQTFRKLGDWAQMKASRVVEAVERPDKGSIGLRWGLTAIDNIIGPLLPGKMVVLGGRPGMGKSALAGQVAEAFGGQGPGYIQSLEMEGEEWAERSMSAHLDIAAWRIGRAKLNSAELDRMMEAVHDLRKLPVWIDHATRLTVAQIRARAIRYKHKYGIRWMIVDHGHIIRPSRKGLQPAEAVNENFDELKQLFKDLKIGGIVLAQMNKEVRNRADGRPRAGDLMYYSSIEPHADSIIFPHRPEVVLAENKPDPSNHQASLDWQGKMNGVEGKAEMINAKARAGKAYQTQECRFIGPTMRFEDLQVQETLLADEEMAGF